MLNCSFHNFIFGSNSVNRWSSLLLLLILTICLTFMGIRLPWGTGKSSGKTKPRPRAVIQNQIKSCKQIIKSYSAESALPEFAFTITPDLNPEEIFPEPHVKAFAAPLLSESSRAPPAYSFLT